MIRRKAEKIEAPKKSAKAKPVKKEPVKKAAPAKKAPAKKPDLKEGTRVYHVVKRDNGEWAVKFAGGEKVIKLFKTQKEAIEYTKKMAENQDGKMLVHNSKGQNKGKIKSK